MSGRFSRHLSPIHFRSLIHCPQTEQPFIYLSHLHMIELNNTINTQLRNQKLVIGNGYHHASATQPRLHALRTTELLRKTGVMYSHLVCEKNVTDIKDRGIHQRNTALAHIEQHQLDGIVYFADDNVYTLIKAARISDAPFRNSQESFQMEIHGSRVVQAADSLLKLVSELKQTAVFSDFASFTEHVEQRVQLFEQQCDETDQLLATVGEQAAASLKELEQGSNSSNRWLLKAVLCT